MSKDKSTFTTDDPKAAEAIAEKKAAKAGTLPASGPERANYLRAEADRMIREASDIETKLDLNIADHNIEIENEVGRALNAQADVHVSKPQKGYRYAWVFRDPNNQFGGSAVRSMQARKYEIVRGKDAPEAQEHLQVTGERWVADCLLMRIKMEHYVEQQMAERERRLALQEACEAPLRAKAARVGVRVLDLGELAEANGSISKDVARGQYHRMNLDGSIDKALKSGTLAGAPQPGRAA